MRLEGFFFIKFEELFYRNGYSSKHDFIYPWSRLSKKLSTFSVREYELTKYLDTVILEDIITPEVRVVHCALCNLWRPHMQKVSNSDQTRSFYCSTVQFILYMLALCFWTNQLFIAIIRFTYQMN